MRLIILIMMGLGFMTVGAAWASLPPTGDSDTQKPLEVNGQSRNLNMMLVLRNDKDKIKFVKIRESYRNEILGENGDAARVSQVNQTEPNIKKKGE